MVSSHWLTAHPHPQPSTPTPNPQTHTPYFSLPLPAAGVSAVGSGGFIPYPGYEYFRADLWYYNLTSSLWVEVEIPADSPTPAGRMDPIFLLLGDVIFMHGMVSVYKHLSMRIYTSICEYVREFVLRVCVPTCVIVYGLHLLIPCNWRYLGSGLMLGVRTII